MRTISWLLLGGCALLLGACGDDAAADPTTSTIDESAVTVTTRHVVLTEPTAAPQTTVDPQMIESCVTYIPFAADELEEPFMMLVWNGELVARDLGALREYCESLVTENPEGLRDVHERQQALDAFFKSFSTAPSSGTAPAVTVAACPEGTRLNEQGFCVTTP